MRRPTLAVALALAGPPLLAARGGAFGQEAPTSTAEASELMKEARARQRDFERFRRSRIPLTTVRSEGRCDVPLGRVCIVFDAGEEADCPEEAPEVGLRRWELARFLERVDALLDDAWVTGQRVRYLAQSGALGDAGRVAGGCGITETWWCAALLGYVLHLHGDWVAAEEAFREASRTLPEDQRERWLAPRYILSDEGRKEMRRGTPADRERRWSLFWKLSDPLYLVEGNDRLTDHFARWVEAEMRRDAEDVRGLSWSEDLEEMLVRYGRNTCWSRARTQSLLPMGVYGRGRLQDAPRVVGHHAPMSRGYLFPEEFIRSPSDVPPESWITAPRAARTWYAPPYAPDFRGLDTQVGRFRRGDEMIVVGAYRPAAAPSPDEAVCAPVEAGLFLVPEDGSASVAVLGTDAEGVLTLRAPNGRYVSSLEVLDAEGGRAWRARQGVRQIELVPGLVAVSDLLVLKAGAGRPASLDEAVPLVRPGARVSRGERFTVVWEVYGLRIRQTASVTLGITRGHPGFLARVGEFLRVIEPERRVEITFAESAPDGVQTVFRVMTLDLPDLEPGEYTLHLRVDLPGRGPAITSRPILVEG